MQETLLTLRGIHRLCIAGCVTVLLLATTPNLANRYQAALEELQELQSRFAGFDHTKPDQFKSELAEFEIDPQDNDFSQRIRKWIAVDLVGEGALETAWSFHPDVEDRVLPRLDRSREHFQGLEQPLSQLPLSTIDQINADGAGGPVRIFVPDQAELRQKLLSLLVSKIPERFGWAKRHPWQPEPDLTPRDVIVRVSFPPVKTTYVPGIGEQLPESVAFIVECGVEDEELSLLWMDTVSATSREVYDMPMAAELTSALTQCRRVWSEVHDLNVTEAMELLKQRKADTTADVTVMGFHFPKHVALLLGPLVTAILFLYLQLHVKHAIPRMNRHGWRPDDFPWIAFYRDRASRLVTVATLVYLPLISCGMLSISEMKLTGEFPWTIATCTLFCTVSGITTLARIRMMPTNTLDEGQSSPTDQPEVETLKLVA